MKVAYFDCFSGASGDMIIGSLLDAGLPLELLRSELSKLSLSHYEIGVRKAIKRGLAGSQVIINIDERHHHDHHRHLYDIISIVKNSDLAESAKEQVIKIFSRLAEAEAKVHQTTVDRIHFHEVGAMDAIIDVTGAVIGLEALGIERVYCSPLHLGSGTIECAHGVLPVPAPATAELIKDKPVYSTGVKGELLTPTGAAILTTLAYEFGPMPAIIPQKLGYGAGTSDPSIPNLLRVIIGDLTDGFGDYEFERVAVLETNIDDMNPQIYDYLIQKMLKEGALDVFLAPIQMKKNRPGTMMTVICQLGKLEEFSNLILRETTTLGLRWRIDNRIKALRSFEDIKTNYGPVTVKIAKVGGKITNYSVEYDDCKRLAIENQVPLKEVMDHAKIQAAKILNTKHE
ncbi:MAG: nickel pincer cofactor biosynthesis protein LarC [Desulfomonilaceae bacterium]